jgi:hypothetical protein
MGLGDPTYKPSYSGGGSKAGPVGNEWWRGRANTSRNQMDAALGQLNGAAPAAPTQSQLLSQFNNAQQYYNTFYAPDQAALQNQFQSLMGRKDALSANYNSTTALTNERFNLLQQQLGAQQQGNGIDLNAAARQMTLADQLLSLLGGKKDQALGYTGQLSGLANQMFGVQNQQLDLKEKSSKRGSERAQAKALSEAIARGAVVTPGHTDDMSFLREEAADQLAQIGTERTAASLAHEQDKAGFTNQTKNILLDFDTAQLNNREQKAQAQDRYKQLEIQANQFGIEKNKLANELASTLQRLQLDRVMTVGQVMDMLSGNIGEQRALAMQIMQQASANQYQFPTGQANLSWGPGGTPTPTAASQPNRSTTGNARNYAR